MLLSASAAAKPWTMPVPADWTDTTAQMKNTPAILAMKRQITGKGGTFSASTFSSPDGATLFVATIEVAMPETLSGVLAYERGARDSSKQAGREASYREERTDTTLNATQRIAGLGVPIVVKRFIGMLESGGLRAVNVTCYGEPTICDPLIAAASVDTPAYAPLERLGEPRTPLSYKLGAFTGMVLLAILLAMYFRRHRR